MPVFTRARATRRAAGVVAAAMGEDKKPDEDDTSNDGLSPVPSPEPPDSAPTPSAGDTEGEQATGGQEEAATDGEGQATEGSEQATEGE